MSRYAKAVMAFFASLGTWGATASLDGVYEQVELWGICGVIAATIGVYLYPNTTPEDELYDPTQSEQQVSDGGLI